MVGLLPGQAVVSTRLEALGYVEVEIQQPCILGPPGLRFRGHQFRYSRLGGRREGADQVYSVRRRRGGEVDARRLPRRAACSAATCTPTGPPTRSSPSTSCKAAQPRAGERR